MKKIYIIATTFLASCLPVFLYAQMRPVLWQSEGLLIVGGVLIQRVIAVAILIAFLFFVWGIAIFIKNADEPTARADGSKKMIWGVVALAVLASVWGIVWWIQRELGIFPDWAPPLQNIYRVI